MWLSLLRAGAVVSGGVFLGRLAGFGRELVLAHKLGGGREADLAVFALTLPDVFTNLLVAGAIGAALMPEFAAAPASAKSLWRRASAASALLFGALAVLGALLSPLLTRALAPGFAGEDADAASRLGAASLASIPLTAAAAVSTAYLQSRGRFALPSLGTLLFNLALIATLAFAVRPGELDALLWAAAAAAFLRWMPQLGQAAALPGPAEPSIARLGAGLARRYVEALSAFGALALAPVAARSLASLQGEGAVATLNYAQKVVELPMGVAVGVLGVVLLPRFSELHARSESDETLRLARQGLWLVWALAVPATLGLATFSGSVSRVLFGHGQMSDASAALIGEIAAVALLGLPAQGFITLLFALFAARRDTARPFWISLSLFAVFVPAAWAAQRSFGLRGQVAAAVVFQWAVAGAYLLALRARHALVLLDVPLLRDLLVSLAAALAVFLPLAWGVVRLSASSPVRVGPALALGVLAFGAILLPRYRVLPDGLRTFIRTRPA